ncbi:dnaJ homolog subfamily C member 18-like [Cottoperca gobio]|uniref:DnaJ homolog subfamily C member 18-like n=1 Tax=Cottoperca gobio TaxID=56716 RepID=A0A6J2S177_COTGO|nr:dnaJ homolog subfamily C member 18-like [Cottoperca gobio]
MAEVRLHFGRGAYNLAFKIYNRHLLLSQNKLSKCGIQASPLSAGFLLGDIQSGELYGAGNRGDRVTVGVSHDSYTRVTTLLGTVADVRENGKVAENYCYLGLNKDNLLSNKSQFQNKNLRWYRINSPRTCCTSRSAHRQSLGLCLGHHGQFVFIRAYSGKGTRSELLYKTKTGYYELLEVSPTATQAQIKTAYYKLSFLYHPDRNAGSEHATVSFSEISEAYSVLGNKALRKKYDRGLLSPSDLVATARPSTKDTGSSAKPDTESRRSVLSSDSRGNIFDFDKFISDHYSEQLQKERDFKVRKEEMLRKNKETFEEKKIDMPFGAVALLVIGVCLLVSLKQG